MNTLVVFVSIIVDVHFNEVIIFPMSSDKHTFKQLQHLNPSMVNSMRKKIQQKNATKKEIKKKRRTQQIPRQAFPILIGSQN